MPLAAHLGQHFYRAEAGARRRAVVPLSIEPGRVGVQYGEVICDIVAASCDQPLTRGSAFRFDLIRRRRGRAFAAWLAVFHRGGLLHRWMLPAGRVLAVRSAAGPADSWRS